MKKKYEAPEIEINTFYTTDTILLDLSSGNALIGTVSLENLYSEDF